MTTIIRAYTRKYRDSSQCKAYVDWDDGSRTEGEARSYNREPIGSHMQALFDRAIRDGLKIEHETW